MLDKIIDFSLRFRLWIIAAALAVVIAGCWIASRMEVDVFPDLSAPTVVVMTEAPGLAPEEVERQVTYPIETVLNGGDGVRRIRSQSSAGFSAVWVEFDWDTDPYRARQAVSEKLVLVGDQLPTGTGQPVMGPQSSILGEVLFVGLTSKDGKTGRTALREIAETQIAPRLRSVEGVAQVAVIGGDPLEYHILLNPERMRQYGVTLSDVTEATRDLNRNVSGGSVYEYGTEYVVRGIAATTSEDELGKTVVKIDSAGMPVLLEDVADVVTGTTNPATGDASINSEPSVIMTVTKKPDSPTIELTEQLDRTVESLRADLPADVQMRTDIYRQRDFIDSSISNIQKSLIEGAIFVVIILFVFLMNPRTVLISLVTLPLALLVTIITLKLMHLTINTMSVGGIAIAIGSLVDDAIVDVENVYKRLRENLKLPEGERRTVLQVVASASKEVRMPILNSTMIIIVSFVPIFFLHGMEGRMLVPLGVAFIVSLLASTLVALTLTPVLCSMLLGSPKGNRQDDTAVVRAIKGYYSKSLHYVMAHSRMFIWGSLAAFAGSVAIFCTFGRAFLPPFNEGSYTVNVSVMPGVSLEESSKVGAMAEKLLMEVPEVKCVARKTGRAELDEHALGVNVSEIEVPFQLKDRPRAEVEDDIRHRLSALPGVNVEVGQPISHRIDAMLSGTEANIAVKLFGKNLMEMYALGKQIGEEMETVEGLRDVFVEQQIEIPQLQILPRREVLAGSGLTPGAFSEAVETLLGGLEVGNVYRDGRNYPILLKAGHDWRGSAEGIGDLLIDTPNGGKMPLSALAEIRSTGGPNTVNRENLERKLVISANVAPSADMSAAVEQIKKLVKENVELPEGYRVEYGGQFESAESAGRVLLFTSLCSIVAIFLLLYNQFRNWKQSAMVMLNLPLALIGGVIAIAMSSYTLSIPAIIGFISLFGIATRNGMLLVDRYNYLTARGMPVSEAIRQGSADRLVPIMMTALTSALAMIPLAAGGSLPGNEIQSPMAKVILGGLISSTILNLYVVPLCYRLYSGNKPHHT